MIGGVRGIVLKQFLGMYSSICSCIYGNRLMSTSKRQIRKPSPVKKLTEKVVGVSTPTHADCPYCGQVGGVSQFDTLCSEHGPALGWVRDGKFFPV